MSLSSTSSVLYVASPFWTELPACLQDRLIAPLFALIDLIGLTLSYMFWQLSGYIHRAAEMKEEVDATL